MTDPIVRAIARASSARRVPPRKLTPSETTALERAERALGWEIGAFETQQGRCTRAHQAARRILGGRDSRRYTEATRAAVLAAIKDVPVDLGGR